jgi:TRAP-type uncharacterized transport system fused permease subunit
VVLLQADAKMFDVFSSIFSAILGTIAFSALTMFYFIRKTTIIEWFLLLPATILLYWPTFATDGAGLVLVALVYYSQKRRKDEYLAGGDEGDEPVAVPAS